MKREYLADAMIVVACSLVLTVVGAGIATLLGIGMGGRVGIAITAVSALISALLWELLKDVRQTMRDGDG